MYVCVVFQRVRNVTPLGKRENACGERAPWHPSNGVKERREVRERAQNASVACNPVTNAREDDAQNDEICVPVRKICKTRYEIYRGYEIRNQRESRESRDELAQSEKPF